MLASVVRDMADVSIIDSYSRALGIDETVSEALAQYPDIVGISLPFSFSLFPAVSIARSLKSQSPDTTIILGGIGASVKPDRLLESGVTDFVALGEAELTLPELIKLLSDNGIGFAKQNLPEGILTRLADSSIVGDPRKPIDNLDSLPSPSFDLLPGFPGNYSARIITSRGCPYRCPYCASAGYWGGAYRPHSPARVVHEIHRLKDTWGVNRISLADDTFNIDRERSHTIAELLIHAALGVEWGASFRPELLTIDDLKLFARSGLTGIFLGLESGSPRVLKSIRRSHDLEQTRLLIDHARQLGIAVHASFMIGLPDETREDIEMTLEYARGLSASSLGFHIFHPLPGSDFGDNPGEYGISLQTPDNIEERIGAIDTYAPISTRHLSALQIMDYYWTARAIAERLRQE
jgi:radical SAM superfamily enzyme YgiQ (UPF0313 family)